LIWCNDCRCEQWRGSAAAVVGTLCVGVCDAGYDGGVFVRQHTRAGCHLWASLALAARRRRLRRLSTHLSRTTTRPARHWGLSCTLHSSSLCMSSRQTPGHFWDKTNGIAAKKSLLDSLDPQQQLPDGHLFSQAVKKLISANVWFRDRKEIVWVFFNVDAKLRRPSWTPSWIAQLKLAWWKGRPPGSCFWGSKHSNHMHNFSTSCWTLMTDDSRLGIYLRPVCNIADVSATTLVTGK